MVVASKECDIKDLRGKTLAIPGELTTAYLLLQLYEPDFRSNVKVMPFHEIMGAVKEGKADAGLIIHESRFTYKSYGLKRVIDLGEWWEKETGLPIPLGCIIAKRSLGIELIEKLERLIRESVQYAKSRRDEPVKYIKEHSQEPDDSVIDEHVKLYVNDYSIDIGDDGIRAVRKLLDMAEERGTIKKSSKPIFI